MQIYYLNMIRVLKGSLVHLVSLAWKTMRSAPRNSSSANSL